MTFETDRGDIARTERSSLAPADQPYQDLIDQLFFGMAGLSADEVKALEALREDVVERKRDRKEKGKQST